MSNDEPAGLKGMWKVDDIVDAPPPRPSAAERASIAESGERLGFASREIAATPPAPVRRAEAEYPARLSLRVRLEDQKRLQDFAYLARQPNGYIFQRAMDLYERELAQPRGSAAAKGEGEASGKDKE